MSVLGGLAELLVNLKALFPGSQQSSWVLMLTSSEALVVFVALLSMMQQLMGTEALSVCWTCLTLYWTQGIFTGVWSMKLKEGMTERWKLYRRVWLEYLFRFVLILVAFITMQMFINEKFPDFPRPERPVTFLVQQLISYYARKTLLAVSGTDA